MPMTCGRARLSVRRGHFRAPPSWIECPAGRVACVTTRPGEIVSAPLALFRTRDKDRASWGAGGERLLELGQPGQVTLQRLAAFGGEPEPRARPPADRALADFHVPGVFEHAGLFRQHRVADPGRITQRGELDPVRAGRQQPADRQPGDRVNEWVRPGGHAAPPPPRSSWRIPRRAACRRATSATTPRAATTIAAASRPRSIRKCSVTMAAMLTTTTAILTGRPEAG